MFSLNFYTRVLARILFTEGNEWNPMFIGLKCQRTHSRRKPLAVEDQPILYAVLCLLSAQVNEFVKRFKGEWNAWNEKGWVSYPDFHL